MKKNVLKGGIRIQVVLQGLDPEVLIRNYFILRFSSGQKILSRDESGSFQPGSVTLTSLVVRKEGKKEIKREGKEEIKRKGIRI